MLHLFSETNTKVTIIIHMKRCCVNAAYINSKRAFRATHCVPLICSSQEAI